MLMEKNDIKRVWRIQPQFTEFELKLINAKREKTGESGASFVRRVTRMFLLGELVQKEVEDEN